MTDEFFDVVIIGGGHAGSRAAEGVREANGNASIAVLGEEKHLPYERPPLSKAALKDPDDLTTHRRHAREHYSRLGIELRLGTRVNSIDAAAHAVQVDEGHWVRYGRLVLATGSRPRMLPILEGIPRVHYLRTIDDAIALSRCLTQGTRLGVIGAGFIGLEVASTAHAMGCNVTVLENADQVLGRILPGCIAELVHAYHSAVGIQIRTECRVLSARTSKQEKIALHLHSGEDLEFDAVVVGVGVEPNIELAQQAGASAANGIPVDEYGRAEVTDIFGAGEVTLHPVGKTNTRARHEFWQIAEQQAYCAGRSAGGALTAFDALPWFWSDQGMLNIQVAGSLLREAQWAVRHADCHRATALAVVGDVVVGVVCINSGKDMSIARRLITRQTRVKPAELENVTVPLAELLA